MSGCHCHPPVVVLDLTPVLTRLDAMEATLMTTATEALTALAAQADANHTALTDLVDDVRALIVGLREEQNLSAENTARVDSIAADLGMDAATMSGLDSEVGDADGSDTPPVDSGDTGSAEPTSDGSEPAPVDGE